MVDKVSWKISETAQSITPLFYRLLDDFRNHDDSYGKTKEVDPRILLTFHVVELLVYLGFPSDSPRLKNSLNWLRRSATKTTDTATGKIFRLLVQKYFPDDGSDTEKDLQYLKALIAKEDFLKSKILSNIPIFPFLALDILLSQQKNVEYESIFYIFNFIQDNFKTFCNRTGDISYLIFLCCTYHNREGAEKLPVVDFLLKNSLSELSHMYSNGLWNSSIIQTAYTLRNLCKLEKKLLIKLSLNNNIEISRNELLKFLSKFNEKTIADFEFPMEIKNIKNAKEIYSLTVVMKALVVAETEKEKFQLNFAHAILKYCYEEKYDPVREKYGKLRIKYKDRILWFFFISLLGTTAGYFLGGATFGDFLGGATFLKIISYILSITSSLVGIIFVFKRGEVS